jgi:hypothetical protein
VAGLAAAYEAAYRVTGDPDHVDRVAAAWGWFLGQNRLRVPVVDTTTGAGFDGLGAHGVNTNQGAESTIAAHQCHATWQQVWTRRTDSEAAHVQAGS